MPCSSQLSTSIMEHLNTVVSKLQLHPLILTGLATLIYWLGLSVNEIRKLRHFPTVGSTLPLLSFISTRGFVRNAHEVVAIGIRKWPGRMFKIPTPSGWWIVVTDSKYMAEMTKAPENALCQPATMEQTLQTQYTFPKYPFNIPTIKTRLTKSLPALVPEMYDEILEACNQYIPANDEWFSVSAFEVMTKMVSRASNRIFVGPILCKNPAWIELSVGHIDAVIDTAVFLRLFPSFLRPLVNYFGSKTLQRYREGTKLLKPIIDARRDEEMKGETESHEDFLTWIMNGAEGDDRGTDAIVERIFALHFAAVHPSSMAVTHILFDLASHPEYWKPLREEVEEVTKQEGWSKSAIDQMHKLDSFLKESQRLNPLAVLLMKRYVLEDYTFSDGTTVPAGTTIGISTPSIHLDPAVYEDPLKFDGLRFIKMKERADLDGHPDKNYDLVNINSEFVGFSQGKHACPGRFFASTKIKLLFAHIITAYDMKLEDGSGRPSNFVRMNANNPNTTAKVYFRKRR